MPTNELLDGIVVLVVEDDMDSRLAIAALLEREGAIVIAVDCAAAALQMLDEYAPDVLLSDIFMPDMDGVELMREIRLRESTKNAAQKSHIHLPAVAMSASGSSEVRHRSFEAGFRFYLSKPMEIPLLLSIVAQLAASNPSPGQA
jgi:CheY-like chemotaxis protein